MKQKYEELEEEYAKYIGTKYAIATNTGTAALHLALKSIGIKEGDEVIVPEFSMAACAFAVSYCGATPIFVDCDENLLIDVKKIKNRITTKTKAIMPAHIYGRICQMDTIMNLAERYKLRVIEDCCEAQGGAYKGKMCGSFDIGVFSFYINKIIPAEEGGIITTNDEEVMKRANFLKNMCFDEGKTYLHSEIGFNYRMPNAEANYALANLKLVNQTQERRYRVASWYEKHLKKKYLLPNNRSVVWVFDLKHPKKDKVVALLNEKGIQARHGFKPMSMQPPYLGRYKHLKAYKYSKEIMYLPVSPLMTEDIVKNVVDIVNSC